VIFLPSNAYPQKQKEGSASLIVMVVAPTDFTDKEYFETRKIFERANAKVAVASIEKGFATSHEGVKIRVDSAISALVAEQFDAIVVIGGMGAINSLSRSESLRKLLIAAHNKHKVVAAICIAPVILEIVSIVVD
jgi:protease I